MTNTPPPVPRSRGGLPPSQPSSFGAAAGSSRGSGGTGGAGNTGAAGGKPASGSRSGSRSLRQSNGRTTAGFGSRATASLLPLLIGVAAVVLSALIVVVTAANGRATSVWFFTLPIIEPGLWWLSLLGYVLTPLMVIVAFGLNRIWQRDGLRDRAFSPRPGYGLALKWMIGASFVLALWHIVNLATVISDLWVTP